MSREPIKITGRAREYLERLRRERPPTDEERVAWKAIGMALDVPEDWPLDPDKLEFLPPESANRGE